MKFIVTASKSFAAAKAEEPQTVDAIAQAGGQILNDKEADGSYGGRTLRVEFANAASADKAQKALPAGWKIHPHTEYGPPKTF